MPRIRFTADHSHRVNKNVIRRYKAGAGYLVSQDCAAEVLAAGKGELIDPDAADARGGATAERGRRGRR